MSGPWPFESEFDAGKQIEELLEGDDWMLAIPCGRGMVDICVASIAIACGMAGVMPCMIDGHPAVLVEHRPDCRTRTEQDEAACNCDQIIVGVLFATEEDRGAVIGKIGAAKQTAVAIEAAYRAGLN